MAKKKVIKESRLDELKRFGAINGVEVFERNLDSYTDFLALVSEKNNSGWVMWSENNICLYGPSERSLLKTWFGHDDSENYVILVPCSECGAFEGCNEERKELCGCDTCEGCNNENCNEFGTCMSDGGKWDIRNSLDWAWEGTDWSPDGNPVIMTKENIEDIYFKSLKEESGHYGSIVDISDEDDVQGYAECFDDYPYEPLPLFHDFYLSILNYTADVDEIVCLEYVKGTDYPEALVKAIPGDVGKALTKIGFPGEGYFMVLHSDCETEWGGPLSDVSYFNCIFYSDLRKKINGIENFHGYLDGNTYAFVVEDTFAEEIPEEVLEFMRKYNPNYPVKP